MSFHSILFEDFIIFSKTKKKAGISNGHFKLMNDYLVGSHRSKARIARSKPFQGQDRTFQGQDRIFRAILGPGTYGPGGTGTDSFFRVQERRYLRSCQFSNFRNAGTCVPQNQYRGTRNGNGIPFLPIPGTVHRWAKGGAGQRGPPGG